MATKLTALPMSQERRNKTMVMRVPRGYYVTPQAEIFLAKRLVKLGGSKALVLDRNWVKVFAPEDWVEIEIDRQTGVLTIRPMSPEKLEVVKHERTRRDQESGGTDPSHGAA